MAYKTTVNPIYSPFGTRVGGWDVDAGDTKEVVTAPGPDPAAPACILCFDFDPISFGYFQARPIGPDDIPMFTGMTYGANVAVGTFG